MSLASDVMLQAALCTLGVYVCKALQGAQRPTALVCTALGALRLLSEFGGLAHHHSLPLPP